jgi:hypothetical protein
MLALTGKNKPSEPTPKMPASNGTKKSTSKKTTAADDLISELKKTKSPN